MYTCVDYSSNTDTEGIKIKNNSLLIETYLMLYITSDQETTFY